jgi:hypothetical protein
MERWGRGMADFSLDWPADCPLIGATDAAGMAYRLTISSPATAEDLKSHYELDLCKPENCKGRGLSVFRQIEHAAHCAELFASKHGWKYISQIELEPSTGLMAHTPPKGNEKSSHHTWWIYSSVDRILLANTLSVIEDV